jgi:hypothetical protein
MAVSMVCPARKAELNAKDAKVYVEERNQQRMDRMDADNSQKNGQNIVTEAHKTKCHRAMGTVDCVLFLRGDRFSRAGGANGSDIVRPDDSNGWRLGLRPGQESVGGIHDEAVFGELFEIEMSEVITE